MREGIYRIATDANRLTTIFSEENPNAWRRGGGPRESRERGAERARHRRHGCAGDETEECVRGRRGKAAGANGCQRQSCEMDRWVARDWHVSGA